MSGAAAPAPEELRAALARWRLKRRFIPEAFATEARIENLESVYRISVEAVSLEHRWVESNGEAPPALNALALPDPLPDGRTLFRVPGSEREEACRPCAGSGGGACIACSGLGRVQCPSCRGVGCGPCAIKGTVDCAACGAAGKERCSRCGGAGKTIRAHVLEIVRSTSRAHRALGPSHPAFPGRPRPVADLVLGDASRLPPDLPPSVRDAAFELIRDLVRPPGKSPTLRLRVEQAPVWGAEWSFGKRKGRAWFHGEPLTAVVPYPPRNVFVLATFVWLALMVPPAIFLVYLAFRPQPQPEVEALKPPSPPPPAVMLPPPPLAPLPAPPPKRPEGTGDALVILAQGGVKRGRLRSEADQVIVTDAEGEHRLQPWEVDAVLEDAPSRIREKEAEIARLEEEDRGALRPAREEVVRTLLRVHRERDSWVTLAPLCRPGELAAGEPPIDRLDALIDRLARLLENPPPAAAPPAAAPPAAPPEDPVPILALLEKSTDPAQRVAAAARLRDMAPTLPAGRDLVNAAVLVFSREAHAWGLERDELVVDGGPVKLGHVGRLESVQPRYVCLRLPQGGRITAFKEDGGAWFVNFPGGTRVDKAECAARRGVRTPAGGRFRAHLDRHPVSKWIGLAPAEHARAAAGLIEPASAGQDEQGEGLLRRIAAAHAAAVLEAGAPAEIEEARATLRKLGFTQGGGER